MDTQAKIDRLLKRLKKHGLSTPESTLYAEGVKTKLRQARFSLYMLKQLEHLENQQLATENVLTSTTFNDLLNVSEKVNFYCDCFWDFLWSALDILGQLVNKLRSLGINEKQVDFKQVADKITLTSPGSKLGKALDNLRKSNTLVSLENYRHCSTHRRAIYIETRTTSTSITGTPGYYSGSTSSVSHTTERYLCTNPWALTPRTNGCKRPVGKYCEQLLRKIEVYIEKIVYHLP